MEKQVKAMVLDMVFYLGTMFTLVGGTTMFNELTKLYNLCYWAFH